MASPWDLFDFDPTEMQKKQATAQQPVNALQGAQKQPTGAVGAYTNPGVATPVTDPNKGLQPTKQINTSSLYIKDAAGNTIINPNAIRRPATRVPPAAGQANVPVAGQTGVPQTVQQPTAVTPSLTTPVTTESGNFAGTFNALSQSPIFQARPGVASNLAPPGALPAYQGSGEMQQVPDNDITRSREVRYQEPGNIQGGNPLDNLANLPLKGDLTRGGAGTIKDIEKQEELNAQKYLPTEAQTGIEGITTVPATTPNYDPMVGDIITAPVLSAAQKAYYEGTRPGIEDQQRSLSDVVKGYQDIGVDTLGNQIAAIQGGAAGAGNLIQDLYQRGETALADASTAAQGALTTARDEAQNIYQTAADEQRTDIAGGFTGAQTAISDQAALARGEITNAQQQLESTLGVAEAKQLAQIRGGYNAAARDLANYAQQAGGSLQGAQNYVRDIVNQAQGRQVEALTSGADIARGDIRSAEQRGQQYLENALRGNALSPFAQGGVDAFSKMGELMRQGAPQFELGEYTESPGLQYALDQARIARERSAAAGGDQLSSANIRRLQEDAMGIAMQDYQRFLDNEYRRGQFEQDEFYRQFGPLAQASQLGAGAASQVAGTDVDVARQMAQNALTSGLNLGNIATGANTNIANILAGNTGTLADTARQTGAGLANIQTGTGQGLANLMAARGAGQADITGNIAAQEAAAQQAAGAAGANLFTGEGANLANLIAQQGLSTAGVTGQEAAATGGIEAQTGANLANVIAQAGAQQAGMAQAQAGLQAPIGVNAAQNVANAYQQYLANNQALAPFYQQMAALEGQKGFSLADYLRGQGATISTGHQINYNDLKAAEAQDAMNKNAWINALASGAGMVGGALMPGGAGAGIVPSMMNALRGAFTPAASTGVGSGGSLVPGMVGMTQPVF